MKKEGISIAIFTILLLLPIIFAFNDYDKLEVYPEIEKEIQKLTYHAEQYESGNENYVHLLLYSSAVKQTLNEKLGAISHEGGLLKQEQIGAVLGEPTEMTKWVWQEGADHDIKLDDPVPAWRKIVFDGSKIQIRLSAYPSIFGKKFFFEEEFDEDMNPEERAELKRMMKEKEKMFQEQLGDLEGKIIYRLHFEIDFKKPEEQLDVQSRIDTIEKLANIYNSNPTSSNAEELAKESVNAERAFENYFRQGGGKCEDIMQSIFGIENYKETMHTIVYEIEFYEGDDFEAIMRLEMCEDCRWNWININMHLEDRGRFKQPEDVKDEMSKDRYRGMDSAGFKVEASEIIDEIKRLLEQGDYNQAIAYSHRLQSVNDAWNEYSNNVYEQVDQEYQLRIQSMTEEEQHSFYENYGWIKEEQEKREKMKEIQQANFQERKDFYLRIFENYYKEEYYFESIEYEKRLVEEFKERGEEICDNNIDDNGNGDIDCTDSQCGGKICGKLVDANIIGNESVVTETDLYCIGGMCTIKEEVIKPSEPICGNHICEPGEAGGSIEDILVPETEENDLLRLLDEIEEPEVEEKPEENIVEEELPVEEDEIEEPAEETVPGSNNYYCPQDCVSCPKHDAIECNGKVIFSGVDENGCQLPPVCVGEKACSSDDDCEFLCGEGGCVIEDDSEIGKCQLKELKECEETECTDGEKKVLKCQTGEEIVTSFCENGLWIEMDNAVCQDGETGEDCEQECWDFASVTTPNCEGEANLKVSGSPPNCECDWECEEIVDDECTIKADCGGENDVCSNGRCVTIPEKREGECPELQISKWCPPDEKKLCPIKTDERGCHEWDCNSCEEPEEPGEEVEEEEETGARRQRGEEPKESPEGVKKEIEEIQETPSESEPEQEENNEAPITGNFIFNFFRAIAGRMTGFVVEEGDNTEDTSDSSSDSGGETGDTSSDVGSIEPPPEEPTEEPPSDDGGDEYDPGPGPEPDNECRDKWKACGDPCPPCDYEEGPSGGEVGEWHDDGGLEDDRRWEEEDNERRCKDECQGKCHDMKIRPCVEDCIMEECGEEFECDADSITKTCEDRCQSEINTQGCEEDCHQKCLKGEDVWKEPEREEYQEHKGVFMAGGGCRKAQGQTEGFIWFNGWGDPFDNVQRLKHKYYTGGEADWCRWDYESLIRQRKEFEEGFNQEFIEWFFEDYIANSAEDWEQSMSGIFELYWRDVDLSREMVFRMQCLGINELPPHNLISFEYESEYGSLKFWEELKTVRMPEMKGEEVTLISPYMEFWFYPPKEFIIAEMKEAMKSGEFPGSPEEKMERRNEDGLTEEQRKEIQKDKGLMDDLMRIAEEYGGTFDFQIQFIDYDTNEVVFNLYGQVNENDIIKIQPMLPEDVPSVDATVTMNFEKLYDIIDTEQRDMRSIEIESPPWDRKRRSPVKMVKQVTNSVKMYIKFRSLMGSAEVSPSSAEGDMKDLLPIFMEMMGPGGPKDKGPPPGEGEQFESGEIGEGEGGGGGDREPWQQKEIMTGEIILE